MPPQATFFFRGMCHKSGTKCQRDTSNHRNETQEKVPWNHSKRRWSRILRVYIKYLPTPHHNPRFLHFLDFLVCLMLPSNQKNLSFSCCPWHLNAWHMLKDYKAKTSWLSCQFVHHDLTATRFSMGPKGYIMIYPYAQGLEGLPTWILKSHGATGNYIIRSADGDSTPLKYWKKTCDMQ